MKTGCLFVIFALLVVLIYDAWGENNTKEETIYSLICALFSGMITAEIIISYLRERAFRRLFGNQTDNIA